MKYKRVIHILSDGRRKYSTYCGEIEKWTEREILSLAHCRKKYGSAAFTLDFSRYDVEARSLRQRFPNAKIIKIVGYKVEDYDLPIDPKIIF